MHCTGAVFFSSQANRPIRGNRVTAEPIPIETDCRSAQSQLQAGGDVLLVDCREQDEYELVHIAGAKLLPMSQLLARAAELDPYRKHQIIVHCHHGGRSLQVATWLRQQGFTRAQSMVGGIDQWAQEIDPSLARY